MAPWLELGPYRAALQVPLDTPRKLAGPVRLRRATRSSGASSSSQAADSARLRAPISARSRAPGPRLSVSRARGPPEAINFRPPRPNQLHLGARVPARSRSRRDNHPAGGLFGSRQPVRYARATALPVGARTDLRRAIDWPRRALSRPPLNLVRPSTGPPLPRSGGPGEASWRQGRLVSVFAMLARPGGRASGRQICIGIASILFPNPARRPLFLVLSGPLAGALFSLSPLAPPLVLALAFANEARRPACKSSRPPLDKRAACLLVRLLAGPGEAPGGQRRRASDSIECVIDLLCQLCANCARPKQSRAPQHKCILPPAQVSPPLGARTATRMGAFSPCDRSIGPASWPSRADKLHLAAAAAATAFAALDDN